MWHVIEPVIHKGETYPLPRDLTETDALLFWFASGHTVYVAEEEGVVVGTYFLRPNHQAAARTRQTAAT